MKSQQRSLNPRKLLLSKWTASRPQHKEKHFLVVKLVEDEQGDIQQCVIEAVYSRRQFTVDWRQLQDSGTWLQGWQ